MGDDKQKSVPPQVVDLGTPPDLAVGITPQERTRLHRRALLIPAIKKRLGAGDRPGENIEWRRFCELIRADIGVRRGMRGYDNQRIQILVAEIRKA